MATEKTTEAPEVKTEVKTTEDKPKVIATNQKFMAGQEADPSPVKTSVERPAGRAWRPKTVAEHNAYVDKLANEQYPA